ncbi:uncharacterized protein N7515_005524 [Penicillium bovifimosum]|uniref:Uncharacterized protein n=1 Tax=Penicillium bovifimosum TaxID=126998 RepID=A0A9W9L079_9EURO|nr:uncharacterized protein N7515_005524 [Penicillium bovifimosum]KAJ5129485.1 hypothetical protein N7515_005524 [Penicillium bovifimosum]
MGQDSTENRQTTAVAGGSSAEPTPANKETSWGEKAFGSGSSDSSEGIGHAAAPNPASTMGSFLGLDDQKTRAQTKYLQRANQVGEVEGDSAGGPSEDPSFMRHKAGDPDTYPGWNTVKNIAGGIDEI